MNVLTSTSSSYVPNMIENIFGLVVPCRKLRWKCRKHSNDVARQVEIPGKSTVFVARQIYLIARHVSHVARLGLHNNITVKHLDTAKDAFSG